MISANMLRHTVTVKRLMKTQGMVQKTQAVMSGVPCTILPMSRENSVVYNISAYKAFDMYTNTEQIKVNDTVTDQSGRTYAVKALNPYENFDNVTHSHYVLELSA